MIHYHGTPITPREVLATMAGRHFCVPFSEPRDLEWSLAHGASTMLDNGAFSAWTRGASVDWQGFYNWAAPHLCHPHWAVIPDVIDGDEAANDALVEACPLPRELAAPVWHLHESLERLARLCRAWPRICFGSSGAYAEIGTAKWRGRISEAWREIEATCTRPWVHMLRAMDAAGRGEWPFASADSTRVARGHAGSIRDPAQLAEAMARRIDARNPRRARRRAHQGVLFS